MRSLRYEKKDEIFPHRTPSSGLFHFHCASRVSIVTRRLAHMLDSLVRVSRRVGWDPTSTLRSGPQPLPRKGEAYRSRPGRTARKPGTRRRARARKPTLDTGKSRVPYNSTPSRSRSPTRSPTCSRRPPKNPPPRRPRKEIGSKRARRPHNGSGDTFRPSRAHPFNPLNGFTHY